MDEDIRQALDTLGEALSQPVKDCACRPPKLLLSIKAAAELAAAAILGG